MRRLLVGLALVIATASYAHSRSGQSPDSGSVTGGAGGNCNPDRVTLYFALDGFGNMGSPPTTRTTGAVAGKIDCHTVQAPCTGTFTRAACAVTTGLASTVGECGLFTADGATRVMSTGPLDTSAAVTLSATVAPFTITSGVRYLACWAGSAVATVAYRIPATPTAFQNTFATVQWNSGTTAVEVAPFNAACLAGSNPYTCCTGVGTGTCLGMADRVGVPGIVAASVMGPVLLLAP